MKKKSGRPKLPTERAKSAVIRARVSQEEQIKIQTAAQNSGLKLTDWIRKVLLDSA